MVLGLFKLLPDPGTDAVGEQIASWPIKRQECTEGQALKVPVFGLPDIHSKNIKRK